MGSVQRIDAQLPAIIDIPGGLKLIIYSGIAVLDYRTEEDGWQKGNLVLNQIGDYTFDKQLAVILDNHEITHMTGTAALSSIDANGDGAGWAVDGTATRYDRNLRKIVLEVALAVKQGSINSISYRVVVIVRN
jgi:hypothetical protein